MESRAELLTSLVENFNLKERASLDFKLAKDSLNEMFGDGKIDPILHEVDGQPYLIQRIHNGYFKIQKVERTQPVERTLFHHIGGR